MWRIAAAVLTIDCLVAVRNGAGDVESQVSRIVVRASQVHCTAARQGTVREFLEMATLRSGSAVKA